MDVHSDVPQSDLCYSLGLICWFIWENCTPTEPGFSQGFFFSISVTDGVLVPLAFLVGDPLFMTVLLA